MTAEVEPRPVVAREDDDRLLLDLLLLQGAHDRTDGVIKVGQGVGVRRGVLTLEFRGSSERRVRHRGRQIQEEGLGPAGPILDEAHGTKALVRCHRIHADPITRMSHEMPVHDARELRIHLTSAFIIPTIASRPHVVGIRRDHGLIEAMRRREEFRRIAEMPLADDTRIVARLLQQRAEGLLVVAQADLGIRSERRAAEAESVGIASGQQRDARRCADRLRGQEVREAQAFFTELIDVGRRILLRTVAAEVSPAHVITHDQDDVRATGEQGCAPEQDQGWGEPHDIKP